MLRIHRRVAARSMVLATNNTRSFSARGGIVKATNPAGSGLMMPWAVLARVVVSVGGVVAQSLFQSWVEEMSRRAKENEAHAAATELPMSIPQALEVLGIAHPDPRSVVVPLQGSYRTVATENFRKYMAKAQLPVGGSPYLAGKFSTAYRLLVDESWDAEAQHKAKAELTSNNSDGDSNLKR